ncbi:TerB family tellurite resistance protein [Winogradskyella rapida]|uniref:TerB family tellurite resistance protein n=1 Tax=Winogradskyella rapida TaxID=549701 RepID=A0ABW3KR66_9FLAO
MNRIDWTRDELVAYILLFAANADFKESEEERQLIISKVDPTSFKEIHEEFEADNDYQGLKKITASLEQHLYTKEDIDLLLEDIKALFFADGDFDITEQNMLRCLERLFKTL